MRKSSLIAVVAVCVIIGAGVSGLNQVSAGTRPAVDEATWTVYTQWPFDAAEAKRRQEETARALGVKVEETIGLGRGVKMTFVLIPAGEFMMGSPPGERDRDPEEDLHRVTIQKPFWIGKHEVTVGQFRAFVGGTAHKTDAERDGKAFGVRNGQFGFWEGYTWRNLGFPQTDEHPVVNVSWNDAKAFCEWLAAKAGGGIALPTEAQWEYACRAGTPTAYQWGAEPDDGRGRCNGADQSARRQFPDRTGVFDWDDGYVFTAPVGQFKANAWGTQDMHGNVWEWCASPYSERCDGSEGRGAEAAARLRVLRGGSWSGTPRDCRSAGPFRTVPVARSDEIGFRVVRAARTF